MLHYRNQRERKHR